MDKVTFYKIEKQAGSPVICPVAPKNRREFQVENVCKTEANISISDRINPLTLLKQESYKNICKSCNFF